MKETNYTVSFDEDIKGWTTFHSFNPDFMVGMNNKFYSFSGANLFEHHSDKAPRNNYYGKTYPSKLSMIFNDEPSTVKELQAISLEGNETWNTLIKAYIANRDEYIESSVKEIEFVQKEGMWYAYARRNESSKQTDSKSLYGIGVIKAITGNTVTINGFNDTMVVGDLITNTLAIKPIGEITRIERDDSETTIVLTDTTGLDVGQFVAGMKDPRIEGGNLRGYSIRVDLETTKNKKVEIFAVNLDVIKSFQ